MNFDYLKTTRIFVGFLSHETLASEIKTLAYELKTRKISLRNHASILIALNRHKKTKYEETQIFKSFRNIVLCNIAALQYNSIAVQFASVGH